MNRTRDHMWTCDCIKTYCVYIIVLYYYDIIKKNNIGICLLFHRVLIKTRIGLKKNKNENLNPLHTIVEVHKEGKFVHDWDLVI